MPQESLPRPRIVQGAQAPANPRLTGLGLAAGGALLGALVVWVLGPRTESSGQFPSDQVSSLQEQVGQLTRDVAVAQRASQVSENAMLAVKQTLFEMDRQLSDQAEEVNFYRRLLDAGSSVRGLAVHEFEVIPTPSPQVFGYRLVLTQNLKKTRKVEGQVSLAVRGIVDDRAATLEAASLGLTEAGKAFEFKYYQQINGRITLPEGFVPLETLVTARVKDSKRTVEQVITWEPTLDREPEALAIEETGRGG